MRSARPRSAVGIASISIASASPVMFIGGGAVGDKSIGIAAVAVACICFFAGGVPPGDSFVGVGASEPSCVGFCAEVIGFPRIGDAAASPCGLV